MLFNSIEFFVFFSAVLLVYFRLPHREQNVFLLLAGFVFYGWWDWRFLLLMMLSIFVDYQVGRQMVHFPSHKKLILLVSFAFNLGILGFFKYFNFFTDSAVSLLALFGMELDGFTLRVILPVGISFYTFQSMSYCIDCYRGKMEPADSLLEYAVYVSFFPQLVAGPIEKAHHLLIQVQTPRVHSTPMILDGMGLMLLGYIKKVVIADRCAHIVDPCFSGSALPDIGYGNWLIIYAFAFQIYGDFSGYTDIARGIAKILGFDLMKNFGMPYLVADPSSFWQHWHISLSTWLRDYLYFSLGGNRSGELNTYRNLMITMAIGGLWHGAGWAYCIWGIFQGLILIIYRIIGFGKKPSTRDTWKGLSQHVMAVFLFFHVTCIGWLIFRVGSIPADQDQMAFLFHSLRSLLSLQGTIPIDLVRWLIPMLVLTMICQAKHEVLERFSQWSLPRQGLALAAGLCLIAATGVFDGTGFIYFQF